MRTHKHTNLLAAAALAGSFIMPAAASAAGVYITEWAYQGGAGEFVEFTNLGAAAVDFNGWSFDDDSRNPNVLAGAFSLSGFGSVASGESVIITEASADDFRSFWGLAGSVKVLGGVTNNLGRNDEINLYDGLAQLVDRLSYGDQNFPGTIRTQTRSGVASNAAALGANDVTQWVFSAVGDVEGGIQVGGVIASPGTTSFQPVPVPAALPLLGSALLAVAGIRRRA